MEIAGAESNVVAQLAQAWLKQQGFWDDSEATDHGQVSYVTVKFEELAGAIQRQVLKTQIIKLGITPDFDVIETLRQWPKRPVAVNEDISISRDATGRVLRHQHGPATFDDHSLAVKLDSLDALLFDGIAVKWGFEKAQKYHRKAGNRPVAGTEFFDANKIGKEIVLRHWRAGDRFQPIGLTRAAKLQDLFTNARVPRDRRHQLVVAEARSGIFWVEGLRISETFKLTDQTERVLTWRWRRSSD
jgi:tRNA(Ile)-lysidine synthetase-like protein